MGLLVLLRFTLPPRWRVVSFAGYSLQPLLLPLGQPTGRLSFHGTRRLFRLLGIATLVAGVEWAATRWACAAPAFLALCSGPCSAPGAWCGGYLPGQETRVSRRGRRRLRAQPLPPPGSPQPVGGVVAGLRADRGGGSRQPLPCRGDGSVDEPPHAAGIGGGAAGRLSPRRARQRRVRRTKPAPVQPVHRGRGRLRARGCRPPRRPPGARPP